MLNKSNNGTNVLKFPHFPNAPWGCRPAKVGLKVEKLKKKGGGEGDVWIGDDVFGRGETDAEVKNGFDAVRCK